MIERLAAAAPGGGGRPTIVENRGDPGSGQAGLPGSR